MNRNTLLPIGSVVLLKNSTKRVMITGLLQRQNGTGTLWDYCACYYPEGIIDPNKLFLFNHEQIDVVFFIGFQDIEELELQKKINERRKDLESEDNVEG